MRHPSSWLPTLLALALGAAGAGHAQIQVVNITPTSLSSETTIDSEPNLAVDPANPLRMAASAFTPNPMGGTHAPIYVSTDGGSTWTLNTVVPGNDATYGTGDITLRFGGTSGILYTGILVGGDFLHLNILRSPSFTAATPMTVLVDRFDVDQPYVQAATVMGGAGVGNDRVYVGTNTGILSAVTQTATIDRTLDGATAPMPAGFGPVTIEARSTGEQDGPPIRSAVHADGTVYGIFYRWTTPFSSSITSDVVVVRTDDWGAGATPFTSLTDPGDGLAGRLVVTGRTIPWANFPVFGQNRFVGSNLSIAVDPRTSDRVWIAWADRIGTTDYTLHVRRSDDRGVNWSTSDLLTITDATNPALAVNSKGRVGFLYQQLTGPTGSQRWQTHFRRSDDGLTWSDDVLADTPADTPAVGTGMYLGDYVHLQALGKDFYGIFPAANTPVLANFPSGVTYQRNADWTAGTLLPVSGTGTVPVSIDPFFFRAVDTPADQDFYVRDWTSSATSADTGLEPSTYPYFYLDSDVWNQLTNTAPAFNANDQPVASNVRNGLGTQGDNFAFARVHRKGPGSPATVNLHFLYANFGIGLNYQDAGTTADPTLSFPAASTQQTLTAGYPWHLDPTVSDHLCLAVEISTPNDAFIPPSLVGSSPGWPSTDLRVLNDNNKAQRNIHILPTGSASPGGGAGTVSDYAIVHNAATFPRTITVRYEAEPEVVKKLGGARVEIVGQRGRRFRPGDVIRLEDMQPGENRWLRVTFDAPAGREGEVLPVHFREMVGNAAVNGFTLAARPSPQEEVLRHNLQRHHAVFARLAALTGDESAEEESRAAGALLERGGTDGEGYRSFLREHGRGLTDSVKGARKGSGSEWKGGSICDWWRVWRLRKVREVSRAAATHTVQLNELDALLTVRQLAAGDPADILQNVRWQRDLYQRARAFERAGAVLETSDEFIARYSRREIGNADYPGFVQGLLGTYRETAQALQSPELERTVGEIERNLGSPAALQKAHRGFLLALQSRLTGD